MIKEGAAKPVVFVIFGATGDLTKRKLIPGIYNLVNHNRVGKFHIIGVARRPLSTEQLINSAKPFIKKAKNRIISKLKNNSSYVQLDFRDRKDYSKLKEVVKNLETEREYDKIFYLAAGSNNFELISNNLKDIGITKQKNCYIKIVFEKPFGLDLKSSNKLNNSVKKVFKENQIYRIDHYLGKELVGNISIVRFSNTILEPIWNNEYIDSIQIILDENIGIKERGPFYDKYGAILDVVQNHMLQLLALLTMEQPSALVGEAIRDKKAKLLKNIKVKDTIVGQYDGYKKQKGINPKSKTETFAALALEINNKRWKGVPVFFKTGKFLDRKETKIVVNFKKAKCLFEKGCPSKQNYLEIRIFPNEGISFGLNAKTPGNIQATQVNMDFCHACTFGPNTPEGYENLFADIMNGDQSVFIRDDELANQWKVIDKIRKGKLYSYKKKSKGPKELEAFNKKNKIVWSQK